MKRIRSLVAVLLVLVIVGSVIETVIEIMTVSDGLSLLDLRFS